MSDADCWHVLTCGITKQIGRAVGREPEHVSKMALSATPTYLEMQGKAMDEAAAQGKTEREIWLGIEQFARRRGRALVDESDATPSVRSLAMALDFTPDKSATPELADALLNILNHMNRQQSALRFVDRKRRTENV